MTVFKRIGMTAAGLALWAEAAAGSNSGIQSLLKKPSTWEQAGVQARQILAQMTPQERFDLVGGSDGFFVNGNDRLGLPPLEFSDTTLGVKRWNGGDKDFRSTAFPGTLLLAAAWDPELTRQYGRAVAREMRSYGIHVMLGPGVNLQRLPFGGRNFEYFGEDPFLVSRMAAAYVTGAQSQGVATTLKHFIGNEMETFRKSSNSQIGGRALRELYMAPFRAGIEAGAWCVMTSYNLLDGEWAGESRAAVSGLLRGELGFRYLVMTDWESTFHGDRLAASGTDIEMPRHLGLAADKEKVFGSPEIDRMAGNILRTFIWSGHYEQAVTGTYARPEWKSEISEHVAFARQVNEQGIVLLKNSGVLPIPPDTKRTVLVTGRYADREKLTGGGSASVNGFDLKTYRQALEETWSEATLVFADNPSAAQIEQSDAVIVFPAPKYEGEGVDREWALAEDELVRKCVANNSNTIVVLVIGGGCAADWADDAAAVIQQTYGGQTAADALCNVISGTVNPSGKLAFTFPRTPAGTPWADLETKPGAPRMGLDIQPDNDRFDPQDLNRRFGNKKRWALGNSDEEKEITGIYTFDVKYTEGIFMGYRWYDSREAPVRYPFGHGLSYTTFGYSGLQIRTEPDGIVVQAQITNSGATAGREIVQLYVGAVHPSVPRPPRELKGFVKIGLAPGETKTVEFDLKPEDLAYYDAQHNVWKVEPGEYRISVAASSRDIRLSGTVDWKQELSIRR
jgi:beta-glucosidase